MDFIFPNWVHQLIHGLRQEVSRTQSKKLTSMRQKTHFTTKQWRQATFIEIL